MINDNSKQDKDNLDKKIFNSELNFDRDEDSLKSLNFIMSEINVLKAFIELDKPLKCIEICNRFGYYPPTVYSALNKLEKKRILKKNNFDHRWTFIGKEELIKTLESKVKLLVEKLYYDAKK